MLLALDYDDTYTRDPAFWDAVIALATQRGHAVICATMRADVPHEADAVRAALQHRVEAIVFTARRAKHAAVHAAGFMPSVWIDDSPRFIHMDACA